MTLQSDSTCPTSALPADALTTDALTTDALTTGSQPNDRSSGLESTAEAVAVRVRYFAGARAAAGVAEETVRVAPAVPGPVRAGDVLDAVLSAHGDRLANVVAACSFLLNGVSLRDRGTAVATGDEVDVLPPFAGG